MERACAARVAGVRLATCAPGAELATLLDCRDPRDMYGYDLIDFLAATERLASWAAARQHDAIRELARRRPAPADALAPGPPPGEEACTGSTCTDPTCTDPSCTGSTCTDHTATEHACTDACRTGIRAVSEFATDEIAAALVVSRRSADLRLDLALMLDRLPQTRAALGAGRLDLPRARAIASATAPLPDDLALRVEDRVMPRAPQQTTGQLGASLRRAVLAVDPRSADQRHDAAIVNRSVSMWELPDGIAECRAIGPADEVMAFYTAVTALADRAKSPHDDRTLDQRRFDVLGDLGHEVLSYGELPKRRRRRPHIQVTVAATTLLGSDDEPGELAGYGPIPASMAQRIAHDGTWRRLLTDPVSGALLDYGRTVCEPPQALADFVVARDQTCRGIGCRQPAARCQLDHRVPYPEGPTSAANLQPLCTHNHRCKHDGGWRCSIDSDNTTTWTTPTGHTYRRPPQPVLGEPPDEHGGRQHTIRGGLVPPAPDPPEQPPAGTDIPPF